MHVGRVRGRRGQDLSHSHRRVQDHAADHSSSLDALVPPQLFDSVRRRRQLEVRGVELESERPARLEAREGQTREAAVERHQCQESTQRVVRHSRRKFDRPRSEGTFLRDVRGIANISFVPL